MMSDATAMGALWTDERGLKEGSQSGASPSSLGPIGRPRRVADEVYLRIRLAIVQHRLQPGERVTETRLAETLGVSKTPVREALLRLHEVGLVSLSDGEQGARVVAESEDAVRNAHEVRVALERGAASLAAVRRSTSDVERLREAAEASVTHARRADVIGFGVADATFHLGVARAAQNPRLEKLIFDNLDLIAALRKRADPRDEVSVDCALAHGWVLEAIVEGSPEDAANRMEAHVRKAASVPALTPQVAEMVDQR